MFILCGAMRSGTTLFNNVLCNAKDTNPHLPECSMLTNMMNVYIASLMNFQNNTSSYFQDHEQLNSYFNDIIENFFASIRKKYNCQHVVIKNPEITPFVPYIAELNKNIKFIMMVRDPRDAIASMVMVGKRFRDDNKEHMLTRFGNDINKFIELYKNYNQILNNVTKKMEENLIIIKYEGFLSDPKTTLRTVENFTGLDLTGYNDSCNWQNSYMSAEKINSIKNEESYFLTELYGKPVSTESIGKHKTILSENDIRTIEFQLGSFMKNFGYECEFIET